MKEVDTALKQHVSIDDSGQMDIVRFAHAVAQDPEMTRWKHAGSVVLAMQAGREMGMSPAAALSHLYVVRGKVAIEGSALRGVIEASGLLKKGTTLELGWFHDGKVWPDGETDTILMLEKIKALKLKDWPNTFGAVISGRRKNWDGPRIKTFSVQDARAAGLWEKRGKSDATPWITYPLNMLEWRATSNWGKRFAADVTIGGLNIKEELMELPEAAEPRKLAPPSQPDPLLEAVGIKTIPDVETVAAEVISEDPDGNSCPGCGGELHPPSECPNKLFE